MMIYTDRFESALNVKCLTIKLFHIINLSLIRKIILIFQLWLNLRLLALSLTCTTSEQQINPKVLSVADFCHNDENSKNGKNSFLENARPLGTTLINSLLAPWQKIRCKSVRVGANFLCKSPWKKLIAALLRLLHK